MILPEAAAYLERIDDMRGQIASILQALPPEALNWQPIEGSDDHAMNSVAALAMHAAGAEHFWIGEVVGGLPATRNRDAEFETVVTETAVFLQKLDKVAQQTHTVLETITQTDLDSVRHVHNRDVLVRWAILHVIDHTSLHLGHMQITTQLWQNGFLKTFSPTVC